MTGYIPIKDTIEVYEGDDITIPFKAGMGNITGYTVTLQARISMASRYSILDVQGVITNGTAGEYNVVFPSASTLGKGHSKPYFYDIKLTAPNGKIYTDRQGELFIEPRTTEIDPSKVPLQYGDMNKSVYDTDDNGIVDSAEKVAGADSANAGEYYGKNSNGVLGWHTPVGAGGGNIDVSTLTDNALIKWDASAQKFVNSGVKSNDDGSLSLEPSSLDLGSHTLSSSAENLMVTNKVSKQIYAPLWQEVGYNKDTGYIRKYGTAKTNPIQTVNDQDLTNPSFTIPVVDNITNFGCDIELAQDATNIEIHVTDVVTDEDIWSIALGDLTAGKHHIDFYNPADFRAGNTYRVKIHSTDGSDVVLKGGTGFGNQLIPAFTTYFTDWSDLTVTTTKDIERLDSNDDGAVDLADKLTGADQAGNSKYYGTDNTGSVGFHNLPLSNSNDLDISNLNQGDIPYWDSTDNALKASGIRKIAEQTIAEPSGFYLGDVNISSDGHGILISPLDDPKTYKVLTQAISANKDEAFIRAYGNPQEKVIHSDYSSQVENPTVSFSSDKDATIVSMDIRSSEVIKELLINFRNADNENIWAETFFNLEAGSNTLTLATPPDVLSGEVVTLTFSGKDHADNPIKMDGTGSTPYLKLNLMQWVEKKIATEEYVNSGVNSIETIVEDTDRRVDNLDTTMSALSQRVGELQSFFVFRGKTLPVFPNIAQSGYFSVLHDLTKNEVLSLPNQGRHYDGALFFLKNEDKTHTVTLIAPTGLTINGGTSINLPPQNTLWLVHNNTDWVVLMSGFVPTSYDSFIADIKSHVANASLGITVDDGVNNFGDIDLLKLKGITATRPDGDSIDSVTLTAATTWGTLGDASSNAKGSIVLAEPPLQSYADPDDADAVRLRLQEGTFEAIHAPGYLAYLNTDIVIIGKTHTATSHADGAIYPTDIVVDNGTYIVKDMKAKAIGLQEADQGDPNVTGGTDYLVAFRIALEGEAPADGFVQIYLAEKAEFGQPVKYLEDSNGHPLVVRRYYHLGDKLGSLETVGVVNAKGLKEFTMHVVDSFDKDDITIMPRDRGVSGVMVQALLPTSKSGLASLQYEVDTEQNIEFTRYYMGNEMTNIDWLSSYVMPLSEGTGGEGADFPDGLHLNNISNLMVGFVDGRMVLKDNGSNMVDFVFGKIEDAVPTYAMREKVLSVKLALTNKDAAFRVALLQWTGKPDEYTQELFTTRSGGAPAFQSGWSLVDSLFIPKDVANEDHEVTHEFTVPKTAVNYAVVIYPESVQQPTELKLKTFNVGAKDPFYFYHIHQSRKLNELHLEYDNEFYESVQDATGLYSLRYTLGDAADGNPVPCGTHRKGKADITLDPMVNQIPGSSASGGEGALKFGKDGQATVNTLLNIASEQAQASNHPTEFWWVTVASDGTMSEIPDSRTSFPISGSSSGMYSMTPFTFAVKAGDRIALRAKSDMPDGAYLISVADKVPLVDVSINFKELTEPTEDDPFANIDLHQFDHIYTNSLTVTKDVGNVSSVTFPITIEDTDHLVVLGAVKQLPNNSIRPVKALDWDYNNEDHTLKVSFGETVLIGRVTLGIYRD
ncbi:hypothetical protein pVco7_gp086 [Vibrio phage pVco-7]|uniref:Uncharacterized protein n=1 Tax=Vibrio phage pVco-5 TaxID=1965485 RepID=A0A1W6JUX2_9CAUD|nr:hypothetical protein KNT61_gp086 [Vibrio phage pVco-5]ARM71074.1 hypothetical protein pVco5_086 [Vibrio phage pVco-5]